MVIDRQDEDDAARPSAAVDGAAFQAAEEAEQPPEPAGPKHIAVIFAHPDDAEFGCAGTVARWVAEGNKVSYVVLTSGDKGSDDPNMTTEQLVATRKAEQQAACHILGVQELHFLDYADAMLVPDLNLRLAMTRVIRQLKPDVVICQDPTVRWAEKSYVNHPDHIAAGEATLAAIYPAARDRLTFPELLEEGLEPHKVQEVYLSGTNSPDVAIDITAHLDTKLEALRAHASQLGDWDPEPMLKEWAKENAKQFPDVGEYVESYAYIKLD